MMILCSKWKCDASFDENYTSKCDSLSNETVEKHKKYKRKRIKRGLYKSGYKGMLLNVDLNGAINVPSTRNL